MILLLVSGWVILMASSQAQHEMKSTLFLDIIVRKGPSVFELFSCEDQTLLFWGNAFLVLDLLFHVFDCVRLLDVERDGFPRKCFNENLHCVLFCVFFFCLITCHKRNTYGTRLVFAKISR